MAKSSAMSQFIHELQQLENFFVLKFVNTPVRISLSQATL